MAKIKTTARKSGGGTASRVNASRRVWHPALTTAAELGEEHLEAALEAEVEEEDGIVYEVHPMACVPHSRFSLPADAGEPSGPASPFPLDSCFGIIAYATWHGHHEVVKAYLDELEADANGAAVVLTEPRLQVMPRLSAGGVSVPGRAAMVDTAPASALQIAVWKRDARTTKLLLAHGANEDLPFLLDMWPPKADSLFATKAGEFSQEGLFCYPPAFRAATQQLLLISHKYGGVRRQDGQLRWGFTVGELTDLLLPAMGRGSMTAWVTPDDKLPEEPDAHEAGDNGEEEQE